jgi:hypothetical protein
MSQRLHAIGRQPIRRLVPWLGGLLLMGSFALGACTTNTGTPGSPNGSAGSATPTSEATSSTADFCALTEQIATSAGVMTNKVYLANSKWTADQYKSLVTKTLDAQGQLLAAINPVMKNALQTELDAYQGLKDSNYDMTTIQSASFTQAQIQLNAYQHNECGFTIPS